MANIRTVFISDDGKSEMTTQIKGNKYLHIECGDLSSDYYKVHVELDKGTALYLVHELNRLIDQMD